jgi:hypothetical protein
MPGVPRELAEHRIDVNEGSKPIKQRLRRFSPDKKEAIKKEITKLMAVRFIRENSSSRLASESCYSTKKEHGIMAHVRRLHRP